MAAYAALVSLNFTIEQIPSSILWNKPHIESLKVNIASLLQFIEYHSQLRNEGIQDLELKITFLCRATEDVIESYVFVQLTEKSGDNQEKSSLLFSEDLQKVMEEFDSIKKKSMEIMAMDVEVNESQRPRSSTHVVPSRSSTTSENIMVGFDEHLINVMDAITSHKSNLQVFALVGMGGIGKTTLARAVYEKRYIKETFQIRLWSTISQSYSMQDIFLGFLHGLRDQLNQENMAIINETGSKDENKLGGILHKALSGRKYLIVLDDVWSTEVWYRTKRFFPDNGTGSRVIVTTRLLDMASHMASRDPYKLELLDEHNSWTLLKKQVFAQHDCPSMLEGIGRQIAASCRGLPLAIVVIGGQLAKSDMTDESWHHVRRAINSIINSEDDNRCLKILSLSYDNLPIHLKPCFLSMGVFPEDSEVCISKLVKLWVSEGFLKPNRDKCLEDTALEHLKDLVKRNLILVSKRGFSGKIKSCRIHDLLRDLCLRKAHEQKFLCIKRFSSIYIPGVARTESNINMQLAIKQHRYHPKILKPLRSSTLSITCLKLASMSALSCRCLTLEGSLFNNISASLASLSSLSMFWNLQSLIMRYNVDKPIVLPHQVWEMSLLRHVEIKQVIFPDPPNGQHYALEKLQTLLVVHNPELRNAVVRRIPNVKKLKIHSGRLDNLVQLSKLESLSWSMPGRISMTHVSFPRSLKKLTLEGGRIPWKDMTMLGSLPSLEVLRLLQDAFYGREWRPIEGEFCRLKYLLLRSIHLEHWEADSIHFPVLESLILEEVLGMREIPLDLGDIATLKLIYLRTHSFQLAKSAEQFQEHQENMGNSDIQVHVNLLSHNPWWNTFWSRDSDSWLWQNRIYYFRNMFWTFLDYNGPLQDKRYLRPGISDMLKLETPCMKMEISEARDEVVKLQEDLDMFAAFYSDSILKRRQDKLVRVIKDVGEETEKIIKAFDTIYRKLSELPISYYTDYKISIARELKAIRLRVQDIYGNVEFNSAYKHWLETWEPQIRSTSLEEINKANAHKAGQQAKRRQGRRLHSLRQIQRQNKSLLCSTPQCRWR